MKINVLTTLALNPASNSRKSTGAPLGTSVVTGLLFTALLGSNSYAEEITLLNHNFDYDAISPDLGVTSKISGWVSSGFGDIGVVAPQGRGVNYNSVGARGQVAYLAAGGRINQSAKVNLQNGETYTLTFDIGQDLAQTTQHFLVRLKADGVIIAQEHIEKYQVEPGEWSTGSLTVIAQPTMPIDKPLVVEFQNLANGGDANVDIDNVRLFTAGTLPVEPDEKLAPLSAITEDKTLLVPDSYPTIHAALDYLDDKLIKVGKTVTIRVTDCTNQRYDKPINVAHPNGKALHFIGNVESPESCLLQFNNSDGFVAANGSSIGLIDGFYIKGNHVENAPETSGVLATYSSFIKVGANMVVSDFLNGVASKFGSSLLADGSKAHHNDEGYFALSSYLSANYVESYNNGRQGIVAHMGSAVYANHANVHDNGGTGIYANVGSAVWSFFAQANNNRFGFTAEHQSVQMSRVSSATNNQYGYVSADKSYHSVDKSTASGNTLKDYYPPRGELGNVNSLNH